MTLPAPDLKLAAGFPAVSRDDWRTLVLGVLRKSGATGEDTPLAEVERLLTSTTYDGIPISPLYTAADAQAGPPDSDAAAPLAALTGAPGLAPYVRGASAAGAVTGGWDVRTAYRDPRPAAVNAAALADLNGGATSLWLTVGPGGLAPADLAPALREVYLDLAVVVLDAGADTPAAAEALFALAAERGVQPTELAGNLGADPVGLAARTGRAPDLEAAGALAARVAGRYPKVRSLTVDATAYHDAGGADAEELAYALATGVAYLRALTGAGLGVDEAFGQLEFRYAVNADQFLATAKLRAARALWARVGEVCGASAGAAAQAQHAVTSSAMTSRRDPWVNMLRTTLAAFGAAVGGADAITVQPFDAAIGRPDEFARRIARNTHALLSDEANLARVLDPAGGSWYVEKLTADLTETAWKIFTGVEAEGGIAAALAAGTVQRRLAETWAARRANIAHRRDPLTGVSEFPNLTEKLPVREALPVREPAPPPAATGTAPGALPVIRYGQDFEAARDRADAHTAATGTPPTVFLAVLGPLAAHNVRATFAANLFAAGGIHTVTGPAGAGPDEIAAAFTASGLGVACLCSSDKLYVSDGQAAASALRAAGVATLLLAGKPGGAPVTVDGHLYAGCDAVAVLTRTLADLGVA